VARGAASATVRAVKRRTLLPTKAALTLVSPQSLPYIIVKLQFFIIIINLSFKTITFNASFIFERVN
jgi:hypothetical protein